MGVKIAAALAWYAEPVDFLERCVTSLAGVVDELVAVDGAWDLFDGGPSSSPDEEEAIWRTSRENGIACRVHVPAETWPSQVAKRAHLMDLAAEHADWVVVIDGDEYLTACDVDDLRRELEETELHFATVGHTNRNASLRVGPVRRTSIRRVYRAGTTVERAHNGYTLAGEWLHGDPAYVHLSAPLPLAGVLELEHDNGGRPAERNEASKRYRSRRNEQKVEAWL